MSLINTIKEMFTKKHEAIVAEVVEVKYEDLKLADGTTVIRVTALEPNGEIYIVNQDGEFKASVGEYTLEDGRVIIVEAEGIIAEVKEAVMEEEASKVEINNEEMAEVKNSIIYLAERIKNLENDKELVKVENSKLKSENEALKNAPVPAEKKKIEFKKLAEKTPEKKGKYTDLVFSLKK